MLLSPLQNSRLSETVLFTLAHLNSIINHISLIGYASAKFSDETMEEESVWASDFRKMLTSVRATSHEITGLLSLLSASIANGQPLPPYLKTPQPYQLSAKLEEIDHDILSVRHIAEPGYAAFAVMQVSSRCIIAELDVLLRYAPVQIPKYRLLIKIGMSRKCSVNLIFPSILFPRRRARATRLIPPIKINTISWLTGYEYKWRKPPRTRRQQAHATSNWVRLSLGITWQLMPCQVTHHRLFDIHSLNLSSSRSHFASL